MTMVTLRIHHKLVLFIGVILSVALLVLVGCEKKSSDNASKSQNTEPHSTATSTKTTIPELQKSKSETIPQELIEVIGKQYPSYMLPKAEVFVKGFQEYTSEAPPFYCSSDFTGDQTSDYAVLLVTAEKDLALFGFINAEGELHGYKIETLGKYEEIIPAVIHICPKGKWESATASKTIENDGVSLELIEESKTISYYWENGQFVEYLYD